MHTGCRRSLTLKAIANARPHLTYMHGCNGAHIVMYMLCATGGERIDLFKVSVKNGAVALTYKDTVSTPKLASAHAMLNDVVLISPDELYITQVSCQPINILHTCSTYFK
jgi:hypothetical protein